MFIKAFSSLGKRGLIAHLGLTLSFSLAACEADNKKDEPGSPGPTEVHDRGQEPPSNETEEPVKDPGLTDPEPKELTLESFVKSAETQFANMASRGTLLPEQQLLQRAVDRAEALGRPLLVKTTGAWCGPCQRFNVARENGDSTMSAEEFAQTYDQFEHLTLEDMYLTLSRSWPFPNKPVLGVPSFFAYDVNTDSWHLAKLGFVELQQSADQLQAVLDFFATGEPFEEPGFEDDSLTYEEALEAWIDFFDSVKGGETYDMFEWFRPLEPLRVLARQEGIEASLQRLSDLETLFAEFPNSLIGFNMAFPSDLVLSGLLKRDEIQLEDLQDNYPELLDKASNYLIQHAYHSVVDRIRDEVGHAAFGLVCSELAEYAWSRFLEGRVEKSPLDSSQLDCKTAELLVGKEVDAEANVLLDQQLSFDRSGEFMSFIMLPPLIRLAAQLERFDVAISLAEEENEGDVSRMNQRIESSIAEIQKLQEERDNTEDPEKRKELEEQIADEMNLLAVSERMRDEYEKVLRVRKESYVSGLKSPFFLNDLF